MYDFLHSIGSAIRAKDHARGFLITMHALPTVADMLEVLIEQGFDPNRMLFIGKPYSTIPAARQKIESLGIRFASVPDRFAAGYLVELHEQLLQVVIPGFAARLIDTPLTLLDSGGLLTRYAHRSDISYNASIQLTSSGSRYFIGNNKILDIGGSQIKKDYESTYIANSILDEIRQRIPEFEARKVCVVGTGAIVQAVMSQLKSVDATISGVEDITICNDRDLVIGATGYDILALIGKNLKADLFSCSSWDSEFRTLLQSSKAEVDLNLNGGKLIIGASSIHYGGCPINFNRHSAGHGGDIAMTRGLALAASIDPDNYSSNVSVVKKIYEKHYGQR